MTYSSSMALSRHRYAKTSPRMGRGFGTKLWGRNQNITAYDAEKRGLGPVSNTIVLIVLACVLGLLYLTQVTKTNAYGYKINSLQTTQAQLKSEHDELEVSSARLQSLDRVSSSDADKNMVSVAPSSTVRN